MFHKILNLNLNFVIMIFLGAPRKNQPIFNMTKRKIYQVSRTGLQTYHQSTNLNRLWSFNFQIPTTSLYNSKNGNISSRERKDEIVDGSWLIGLFQLLETFEKLKTKNLSPAKKLSRWLKKSKQREECSCHVPKPEQWYIRTLSVGLRPLKSAWKQLPCASCHHRASSTDGCKQYEE